MLRTKIAKQWQTYSLSPIKVYPITPKIKTFDSGEETDKSAIQLVEQDIPNDTANESVTIICLQETNEKGNNNNLVKQDKVNESETENCPQKKNAAGIAVLYLGKTKYKNRCTHVFQHDDMIKLRVIVDRMPYKTEKCQSDYYELPLKTLLELADSYLKDTNFLMALRYYADCALLCVEDNQKPDKFCNKLYSIREYFTDFPDLKESIHGFLNAIRKYEKNDQHQQYYLSVKSSYHRLVKVIKMEDIFEVFDKENQIAPNFPPEIRDFNGLFFNWIYKNNLGMYFTNLASAPILRDTLHMRAYKKFLWMFKAKFLFAIPNVSNDDGYLSLKMAYKIQDTNEYMAAEFAKKALTIFKSCKNLKGQLSIHEFLGKYLHMDKFKDYIFEEQNGKLQIEHLLKSIFNRFKF